MKGIAEHCSLPDKTFDEHWDRIIVPEDQKQRIVLQAVLNLTVRRKLPFAAAPLHGLIVLVGPPGTGKTSLARGVASKTAKTLGQKDLQFLKVEPHGLTSSALGKSQRAVQELLEKTIAERAEAGPLIVLLDEVETLAADRKRMSLEANPIDVHRATDAVLAGLDDLGRRYPELLFIATSNFKQAIDDAFLSRADLVEHIALPDRRACRAIALDTLSAMASAWPKIEQLLEDDKLDEVAEAAKGLDGRALRKAILHACCYSKETAKNPGLLTAADLLRSVRAAAEARQ